MPLESGSWAAFRTTAVHRRLTSSYCRAPPPPSSTGAGLADSARKVLKELEAVQMVDVVMVTKSGIEIRKRCVSQPMPHPASLLHKLRLNLPRTVRTPIVVKTGYGKYRPRIFRSITAPNCGSWASPAARNCDDFVRYAHYVATIPTQQLTVTRNLVHNSMSRLVHNSTLHSVHFSMIADSLPGGAGPSGMLVHVVLNLRVTRR
jgi:hypothetical protein